MNNCTCSHPSIPCNPLPTNNIPNTRNPQPSNNTTSSRTPIILKLWIFRPRFDAAFGQLLQNIQQYSDSYCKIYTNIWTATAKYTPIFGQLLKHNIHQYSDNYCNTIYTNIRTTTATQYTPIFGQLLHHNIHQYSDNYCTTIYTNICPFFKRLST
jgi:hypothetical protein